MKEQNEISIARLIMNSARLIACRTDRAMEAFGLYRGQAILLHILANSNGMTHSELAEELEISPAAATKVIKKLEAMHYLERRPDPSDERLSRVFIKQESSTVLRQIRTVLHNNNRILCDGLSPEELSNLAFLLKKIQDNARKLPGETVKLPICR